MEETIEPTAKKKYQYIGIHISNIPQDMKHQIKHLSENMGYTSCSKFHKDFIKNIIKENEMIAEKKQEFVKDFIYIQHVSPHMKNKIENIAHNLGFRNLTDFLRSKLKETINKQPVHMLKKNKGFKEIE